MTEPDLSEILVCSNCGNPVMAGDAIMLRVPDRNRIFCELAPCREVAANIVEVATAAPDEDRGQ